MCEVLTVYPKENTHARLLIGDDENAVYLNGEKCPLTRQEYSLLTELARTPGDPVSRDKLLKNAWG